MALLTPVDHVVVVGAGVAGWRLVEALRRDDYEGAITLIGDEPQAPYDRPPLSKQLLAGKWDLAKATLATPERLETARVSTLLGVPAVSLDVAATSVELADGRVIAGTRVVLATGSRARGLSFASSGPIATLRSAADLAVLLEVIDQLDEGSVVAVIGGGFLGAEMATSAKARGLRPVVLEAMNRPLLGVLGETVSSWLADIATRAEVELRTDQRLRDVRPDGDGWCLDFEDGTTLRARAVVAAIGSVLDVEWLGGSGLEIDNGIVVDRHLECAPGVAAIGDLARFSLGERSVRVEHWQVATDHAAHLAHYWMTGEDPVTAMVPYFWSDQYGKKIQMLGHPAPDDDVVMVEGSVESGRWLAFYSRRGVVNGIVSLSQPRALALAKPLLEEHATIDQALARAPWAN